MIIIKSFLNKPSIFFHPVYSYHVEDLMKRSYKEHKITIYAPANHLYIDKLLKEPFDERKFIYILLQEDKLNMNVEITEKLFKYAKNNIQKFEYFKSMSALLNVAFENKLNDAQACEIFARKGFLLLKDMNSKEVKGHGYNLIRFMIGLSKIVGLQKFKNQDYELIDINKIKPIFITFLLELFWRQGLQYEYAIVKKFIECLRKNQHLIPFSDVHHMMMIKKKVRDPQFFEITDRLQERLKEKIVVNQETGVQTRVSPQVTIKLFNEYIKDLEAKYI